MKLLSRSTYYFMIFSAVTMVIAGMGFYYAIRTIVYRQIDNSLITEKTIIKDQIDKTDSIPDFSASFGHQIEVRLLRVPAAYSQSIRDTDIYDSKSSSSLPFRHLRYTGITPGRTGYRIEIYQILDENQQLLDSIALGMFFLFLALFLISLIVNYVVSKRIWSPFYDAVNQAENFNILSDNQLQLPDTNINEFRQLNEVLEKMTKKMRLDYINLKEYNENSSHEIQTPLAVIRSKLDILIQNQNLNRESIDLITSMNEAVSRIFKLNQGLLLMSKIENLQFEEKSDVSLRDLLERSFQNYEEIMQLKNIKVEKNLSDPGLVRMNELLADVMITNLLGNAVRYNNDNGFIKCSLNDQSLSIVNSGPPLRVDPENLFKRFRRGSDHPESVGLGLSIVKKICDHYRMDIRYTSSGNIHEITLKYLSDESGQVS